MKRNYLLLTALMLHVIIIKVFAANGDTTRVKVFDQFAMTRYGDFDKKANFPSVNKKFQRIWLKYTIGCQANGQCEWDYTNLIYVRQHTGKNDSTLNQAPSFKMSGQVKDSINFSYDTTWVNVFDSISKKTDSVPSASFTIIKFNDAQHPLTATDTLRVWPVSYYRFHFDSSGKKTDSLAVPVSQTLKQTYTPYYTVFEMVNNYELARMITPYAKNFPKTFAYTYTYDVTDFISLLHDSAEIRITYSGYSYGFTASIDFEMIEGTPAREAYKVENVYMGYFPYGNAANPIENYLPAKSFTVDDTAKSVKLIACVTGHGEENNEGCSEFCAKKYFLKLDSNAFAQQLVWKDDCGSNPIINQGGTWIFKRGNWCPGEQVRVFEYELNVSKGTHTIDMDFENFTASGSAGYQVQLQLIYYKDFAWTNDAGIEEILWPSNDFQYNRMNPICDNARVSLINFGKAPLTNVTIKYQSGSNASSGVNWTGNLAYGQSTTIDLPYINWDMHDTIFKVWVEKPNGNNDENTYNDLKETRGFNFPPVLPLSFIIETYTNKRYGDNSWTLKDQYGKIQYRKTFDTSYTLYRDTVTLGYGCYTLELLDSTGDGLEFWYTDDSTGIGWFRVTNINPYKVLKSFKADFGNFIRFNFRAGSPTATNDLYENEHAFEIFPNPANNELTVLLATGNALQKELTIYSMDGKTMLHRRSHDDTNKLDVSFLTNGLYIVEVKTENSIKRKKIIINR